MEAPYSMLDIESRQKRARYRAKYRGTKELDILLGQFSCALLDNSTGGQTREWSAEERLSVVEWLVAQPDYVLQPWLMDGQWPQDDIPELVAIALRAYNLRVAPNS